MNKNELTPIIYGAKRGKQADQSTLMNLFWDRIYFFILNKIGNKTDAEDITVKTFTKVFRKLKLYNEDFDFLTWLRAIAYNTMIDHIRQSPDLNISIDDELTYVDLKNALPSPEQTLITKQNTEKLLHEVNNLPPIYAEIIRQRYLEEKTYKEIAHHLGLSLSNVKVRLKRAKHLLEEALKKN